MSHFITDKQMKTFLINEILYKTLGRRITKEEQEKVQLDETDLARNFDFPATQSLSQAEAALNDEIVKSIVNEIFNKIFSNW